MAILCCSPILELRGTGYTYRTQYQQVEALKGVSYSFETGKLHAIMGRSGSGKTTLLSLMAGLDLPTAGQVLFEGTSTAEMDLERYRREKAAVMPKQFFCEGHEQNFRFCSAIILFRKYNI